MSLVRHVATATSTNDLARAWADEGAPHGAVVSADHQTAGRGRLQRRWASPPGQNLAMSVVLRRDWVAGRVPWACLAAAVAVAEVAGPAFRIKWPNDVQDAHGRKVAGILAEAEWGEGRLRYVVVGIGVNVAWSPPDLPHTSSLAAAGVDTTPLALRDEVARALLSWVDRPVEALAAAWTERSATLGRHVRIGAVEGLASHLLGDGGLAVRVAGGDLVEVRSGDVEMVSGGPA